MATLFTPPRYTPVDGNGATYPGGKLYFYTTGTTTPKNTYSDSGLGTPNANPVVADADGLFGPIYLASGDYKVILKTSADTTVWTVDPQPGLGAGDALTTRGDLLTRDASGYKRLALGTVGQVLTSDGVDVEWAAPMVPRSYIQGLTYSNNVADATNDIDIAIGCALDGTNVRMIVLGSAITKRLDASWTVGNNQGGLDTGSIGNSDYYMWLIERSDTGVVDVLFSLSATAPTMPTNYDYKRLIGWFKRESAAIVAFKTYELWGGGLDFAWVTPRVDVFLLNTLTTSRRTDVISVPLDFSVLADITASIYDASGGAYARVMCPNEADVAPTDLSSTSGAGANIGTVPAAWVGIINAPVRTSAAGLIAARATGATVDRYTITTAGFKWARRP